MSDGAVIPTQSAFLELREERAGLQEGARFLDEKRLILAAELLRELGRFEHERGIFEADYAIAAETLRAATARHGLEGLLLYPSLPAPTGGGRFTTRSVLGVPLIDLELEDGAERRASTSVAASPEADACREAFGGLIARAARLATMGANLERLRREYARTARRARALEDVLLPEMDATLEAIASALEEQEREESARARRVMRAR